MEPCNLKDLSGWLESAVRSIPVESHRRVILEVSNNLDSFVKWPTRAELLWEGCDRKRENAQQQRYHAYPPELKAALPAHLFQDRRSNGPAIIAYAVGGGERPLRSNGRGWNIHHLYDGKFPYPGNGRPSLQAVKEARHFTQSAGLVASSVLRRPGGGVCCLRLEVTRGIVLALWLRSRRRIHRPVG